MTVPGFSHLTDLLLGLQITYVPHHVDGPDHPQAEHGFITSVKISSYDGLVIYCRFWTADFTSLRTRSCSERVNVDMLVRRDSVPQEKVQQWLTVLRQEGQIA